MLTRILVLIGLAAAGLLLFIITTVAPSSAGASGILAVFILSYVVLLCLLTFFVWISVRVVGKIGKSLHVLQNVQVISLSKAYYYSSVVSLGVVIVASLRSVGTVGIYELSLVTLFVLLGCVYVARRT
ncbi:MAG: hypothetical protein H6797_05130 [Candidatus Nomurabacteria bacterium]|nr:MAG: hypothetical protein H6797_05130 [Candidatus Nomurabacteria bacterium]